MFCVAHLKSKLTIIYLLFCDYLFFFLDSQNNKHCENKDIQILPIDVVNSKNNYADNINNLEKNKSFDNLTTLNDLFDSIQTIANRIELTSIDSNFKEDNNKYSQTKTNENFDSKLIKNDLMIEKKFFNHLNNNNVSNKKETNKYLSQSIIDTKKIDKCIKTNWFGSIRSTSLIRAANFICDKIVSTDVPRQLIAKHSSSISSFFNDESSSSLLPSEHKNKNKKNTKNINFSRGRSTEKRSNTNSDSSLPSEEKCHNDLKARFYHHEDDYSKKLRRASRQRREAAALAAKKSFCNTKNNNILADETVDKLKNLSPLRTKILLNKSASINNKYSSNENLYTKKNSNTNNDFLQKNKVVTGMRRTNSVNSMFIYNYLF